MNALWRTIHTEVLAHVRAEPQMREFLNQAVLNWDHWRPALANWLTRRLGGSTADAELLHLLLMQAIVADERLGIAAARDLRAVMQRDPACREHFVPFLFYKGFHALQIHRAAHWHWQAGRRAAAYLLQHRCSEALAIDIHPAVRMGSGVMLDHGTGFVAGETAVIGDDVNLLHEVTLGGTGKQSGDRHPKLRNGVSVGAGAKILGNIEIGAGARIGAGSVVLQPVPSAQTAVGTRARLVQRRAQALRGEVGNAVENAVETAVAATAETEAVD